ncbi:hypothetical protein P4S95_09180 [Aneurinibacillus aneurinilyticus]|uniref:hypothetical protein n=1 Tax=Aneurinibacillus aneurinilyticus TaxID=1391 RepID=UPI002E20ECBC|nr:hypothetical protein [Aneurinibacillus aneurinilyticus]
MPAMRSDFDNFYRSKETFEVKILDNTLHAVHIDKGCADLQVTFRNLTSKPVTLTWGTPYIKNKNGIELSRHNVYGLDEYVGADFTLYLSPHSEKFGYLYVGFSSSTSVRLDLDEDGITEQTFTFELVIGDTMDSQYTATVKNSRVFAQGDFLWKVRLKS